MFFLETGNHWNTGMELVVKEHAGLIGLFIWFHSLAQCQSYKGYISRTSVHRAGLSALFSNHSCLVVFIQRAPGNHSTGLLSVSSSPPAPELLLPAPVYSALLSKPHLNKLTQRLITEKKSLKRRPAQVAVMFLAHSRSRNVPRWQINKLGRLSGMQSAQMPTRCHCFSALGHIHSVDIWYFLI